MHQCRIILLLIRSRAVHNAGGAGNMFHQPSTTPNVGWSFIFGIAIVGAWGAGILGQSDWTVRPIENLPLLYPSWSLTHHDRCYSHHCYHRHKRCTLHLGRRYCLEPNLSACRHPGFIRLQLQSKGRCVLCESRLL